MRKTNKLFSNEQGFASIVIALVMILVLGLVTIGFAQLARREQQNALSKQLAIQANYAAESGINDAYKDILSTNPLTALTVGNSSGTTCMTKVGTLYGYAHIPAGAFSANNILNQNNGVSFSCLLVDLQPPRIEYGAVQPGDDRYLTFTTDAPPATLTIHWRTANNNHSFPPTSGPLLPVGSATNQYWNFNNYPAVLKFSITPVSGFVSRTSLISDSMTVYLYPSTSGQNVVNYSNPNNSGYNPGNGQMLSGNCAVPSPPDATLYDCQATINNLGTVGGMGPYIIHLIDYYDASDIAIDGCVAPGCVPSGSGSVHFIDGQAVIDVTGQARNVLKRLRVTVPLKNYPKLPKDTIEATNVCKRFTVDPVNGYVPDNTLDPNPLTLSCDVNR